MRKHANRAEIYASGLREIMMNVEDIASEFDNLDEPGVSGKDGKLYDSAARCFIALIDELQDQIAFYESMGEKQQADYYDKLPE